MKNYLLILSLLLSSFAANANQFSKVRGNGVVTTQERNLGSNFHSIDAGHGIDVYLTHGKTANIKVETDENLQEVIITKVVNGVLTINTNKNISKSTRRNVYVTYVELKSLDANSGADIKSNEVLKSQKLNLNASSGGDIELEILSEEVTATATSGGEIDLKGKTLKLNAEATSGGEVDAENLAAIHVIAKATSGGSVEVNAKTSIHAGASSGGKVEYSGNPTESTIQSKISGKIKKK